MLRAARILRDVLRTIALALLIPWVMVVAIVMTGPPTWSAAIYVVALGVVLLGLMTLPVPGPGEERIRPPGVTRLAVATILITTVVRGFTAGEGESLHLETLGARAPITAQVADRAVDEADIAVNGMRVLLAAGLVQDDVDDLPDAIRSGYVRMREEEGDAPSPFLATHLKLHRPSTFGLVVVEPRRAPSQERAAILFLHGFAGNLNLPCWQVAQAVADLDVLTACPSTLGDWWSPEGEETVRRAVATLHERGASTIVLMGVANGGIGASRLVARMPNTFAGVVLVSGVAPDAPPPGVPTLVIHGTRDTTMSATLAREYALRVRGDYFPLRAGHFAMLVRRQEHDRALRDFVADRVKGTARASL